MSEHIWIVPVSCGRGTGPTTVVPPLHPKDFNVQWDFEPLMLEPGAELACLDWTSMMWFGFPPLHPSAQLSDCFARWTWRSCAQGGVILTGGQLAVGTVFSRKLPTYGANPGVPGLPFQWNTVEAWVKYKVTAVGPLSAIYFVLNDSAGNWSDPWMPGGVPQDWLPTTAAGVWRVAWTKKIGNWTNWTDQNLRATAHFVGTHVPANVGRVDVDIEWFAFKLSVEQ